LGVGGNAGRRALNAFAASDHRERELPAAAIPATFEAEEFRTAPTTEMPELQLA